MKYPTDEHRTSTVLGICHQMRATRDYVAMPILADALQDAGYDENDVLTLLREPARRDYYDIFKARLVCLILGGDHAVAVDWIDDFASELDQTYNRLITAANEWVEQGEYTYDNSETYKNVDYDKWPTFWDHYEKVMGLKPSSPGDTFFTCSC